MFICVQQHFLPIRYAIKSAVVYSCWSLDSSSIYFQLITSKMRIIGSTEEGSDDDDLLCEEKSHKWSLAIF